jgi:hypothetical protein
MQSIRIVMSDGINERDAGFVSGLLPQKPTAPAFTGAVVKLPLRRWNLVAGNRLGHFLAHRGRLAVAVSVAIRMAVAAIVAIVVAVSVRV